jgi:alpha,alpha-trehalase
VRHRTMGRLTIGAATGLIAMSLVVPTASAQPRVILSAATSAVAGALAADKTITLNDGLAPILRACLFAEGDRSAKTRTLTQREFSIDCVVPYINGLWLDEKALFRTHEGIAEQARDELIIRPPGAPFPIFYPPQLADPVLAHLRGPLAKAPDVVAKPLPAVLPRPSLSPDSLYNNIGLLYLPNAYVVPGGTFNEMYGWDSYFIIRGMLASVDYIMRNPTARIWSAADDALIQLTDDPNSKYNYRAVANRLFQVAKGMVDNHIFEITYYGGFILNANRTYYLGRSQPPLFTQEALAVLGSAQRYGFPYQETLAPYLEITHNGFTAPKTWHDWIKTEVLPAAQTYYAYWTDPKQTQFGSSSNPRIVSVAHAGAQHSVYVFGTDGLGPAPEVARSTQPQNRELYAQSAKYFAENPDRNPDQRFYNPTAICTDEKSMDGCGDPIYKLTQAFYRADRAVRASGFDLSGRFGDQGEWTMDFAPVSLNVLLLQMARDIDRMAALIGEAQPFGAAALAERRAFLKTFFARASSGYADRFVGGTRPDTVPEYTYPYATQFYLLWGGVFDDPKETQAFVATARDFLGRHAGGQYGIPTSFVNSGKQWDLPYAWAPIQFFAADGLAVHGFHAEAARVMLDWIITVNVFFSHTGIIIEKYDYTDPTQDPRVRIGYSHAQHGFGWTNGVYMMFINRLYGRL